MAKTGQSASKQRKERKKAPKVAVEVNERQIAGGSLATTGDRGSDFITRVADFLQANGVIVLGVLAIGLIIAVVSIWQVYTSANVEADLAAEIAVASNESEVNEVIVKFDDLAEKLEDAPEELPKYYYNYALTLYQAHASDEERGEEEKAQDRAKINELIGEYEAASEKYDDPARERRVARLQAIRTWMNEYEEALANDKRLARLEKSTWKPSNKPFVVKSAASIRFNRPQDVQDGDALVIKAGDDEVLRLEFDSNDKLNAGTAVSLPEEQSAANLVIALRDALKGQSGLQASIPRGTPSALVIASSKHEAISLDVLEADSVAIDKLDSNKRALIRFAGQGATIPLDGESFTLSRLATGEEAAQELALFEFDPAANGTQFGEGIAVPFSAEEANAAGLAAAFLRASEAADLPEGLSFTLSGEAGVEVTYSGEGDLIWDVAKPYDVDARVRAGDSELQAVTSRIRFETSRGTFYLDLYEVAQLENTVNTLITLTEREGYNETSPNRLVRPGITMGNEHLFEGAWMTVFGQMVKLAELPKGDAAEDEATDEEVDPDAEPERTMKRPYFAILRESAGSDAFSYSLTNERGTVNLFADLSQPNRRGTQFAINLSNNTLPQDAFPVIGYITDKNGDVTDKVLDVVARMTTSDKIYRASVVRKQDRDYTPMVVMLEGPNTLGLPQPWHEKKIELEQPRLEKPEGPKIVGDDERPQVVISVEGRGDVLIELYEDETPNTVANFIYLAEQGTYKDTLFHRVEGQSGSGGQQGARIVQGGSKTAADGHDWTIKNEALAETYDAEGLNRNITGTISMARTNDLDGAGKQFFINLKDYPVWDNPESPYAVFGRVLENLWVLYNVEPDDVISDVWVVQKRDHHYIPTVRRTGEQNYAPAEELPEEEAAPADGEDEGESEASETPGESGAANEEEDASDSASDANAGEGESESNTAPADDDSQE